MDQLERVAQVLLARLTLIVVGDVIEVGKAQDALLAGTLCDAHLREQRAGVAGRDPLPRPSFGSLGPSLSLFGLLAGFGDAPLALPLLFRPRQAPAYQGVELLLAVECVRELHVRQCLLLCWSVSAPLVLGELRPLSWPAPRLSAPRTNPDGACARSPPWRWRSPCAASPPPQHPGHRRGAYHHSALRVEEAA